MGQQLMNLPFNIPWKLIAVRPDMMDTKFCNKRFPFRWRPSLAISAYEPRLEDLPEDLCERITYLKITCSITGYQPSVSETEEAAQLLHQFLGYEVVPTEQLDGLLGEYFACYGVLVNVAVFPYPDMAHTKLEDYPHIVDFEPKVRDLYQAATESGEILTSSTSEVSTDKTLTKTRSSETGISGGVSVGYGPVSVQAQASHTWGSTDADSYSIQRDKSRERRETQGCTTNITQMYNLLTGYHACTNRALFLMLPRPHILASTDFRTFIQGLRIIEGIQEFFLIVTRPKDMEGISVEASLETGHFPEETEIVVPPTEYDTKETDFEVNEKVNPKSAVERGSKTINVEKHGFEVDGWAFDPTRGVSGCGGMAEILVYSDDNAKEWWITGSDNILYEDIPALRDYSYWAASPDTAYVKAKITSGFQTPTRFHRKFRVYLRKPKITGAERRAEIGNLIITSRGLCASFKSGEKCPEVVSVSCPEDILPDIYVGPESIVGEHAVAVSPAAFVGGYQSRSAAAIELLDQIQFTMASSWRLPGRRPFGAVGFLDSDYFKKRIRPYLPKKHLERPLAKVSDLPASVVKALGAESSVTEALKMDLNDFAQKTKLPIENAVKARRMLLGLPARKRARAKPTRK